MSSFLSSPNLVTLIGFLFVVAAFCSVLVFVPDLVGPVHPAFYFAYVAIAHGP